MTAILLRVEDCKNAPEQNPKLTLHLKVYIPLERQTGSTETKFGPHQYSCLSMSVTRIVWESSQPF